MVGFVADEDSVDEADIVEDFELVEGVIHHIKPRKSIISETKISSHCIKGLEGEWANGGGTVPLELGIGWSLVFLRNWLVFVVK